MYFPLAGYVLTLLATTQCALAAPLVERSSLERRAGAGPWFVVYTNKFGGQKGPPPASKLKGYNVVALSFLQTSKALDKAAEWAELSPDARKQKKKEYNDAGIKVIVSLFGEKDKPTTQGVDAVKFANTVADWVKKNDVDGVDVDYEDLPAFDKGDGKGEQWVIAFTKTLRGKLGPGKIISHAPVAPWFSNRYKGGGYLKVHKEVGSMIDFYNIQFYNQPGYYETCSDLLNSSKFKGSALFEISGSGVPLNKLVIGKPGGKGSAGSGHMDPNTLSGCVAEAKKKGWAGGIMAWEYPEADSNWITTARGTAFPVGGGAAPKQAAGKGKPAGAKKPGAKKPAGKK